MLQKIPQSYKLLFWSLEPWAAVGSVLNCFALLAGGMVHRYQPGTCVLVAFSVNYWQTTNSSEESLFFSYAYAFSPPLGLAAQAVGPLGKGRGLQEVFLALRRSPEKSGPWVGSELANLNRGYKKGRRVTLDYGLEGRTLTYF